jgi:hypothetical protein
MKTFIYFYRAFAGLSTNAIINHATAAMPIKLYTIFVNNVAGPNKNATKSNPKIPIKPQFKAPMNINGTRT